MVHQPALIVFIFLLTIVERRVRFDYFITQRDYVSSTYTHRPRTLSSVISWINVSVARRKTSLAIDVSIP